jgi:hypothetical protein
VPIYTSCAPPAANETTTTSTLAATAYPTQTVTGTYVPAVVPTLSTTVTTTATSTVTTTATSTAVGNFTGNITAGNVTAGNATAGNVTVGSNVTVGNSTDANTATTAVACVNSTCTYTLGDPIPYCTDNVTGAVVLLQPSECVVPTDARSCLVNATECNSNDQGEFACPVEGRSAWRYGLPAGLTLTPDCRLNGTLLNNTGFPAPVGGVSFLQFRAVIRVSIPQSFTGETSDLKVQFKVNAPLTIRLIRGTDTVLLNGTELVNANTSCVAWPCARMQAAVAVRAVRFSSGPPMGR